MKKVKKSLSKPKKSLTEQSMPVMFNNKVWQEQWCEKHGSMAYCNCNCSTCTNSRWEDPLKKIIIEK